MSNRGDVYDVDGEEPGVPKSDGESWGDVADRAGYRDNPADCPACGTEGDGDDVLAGGQRWCTDPDCDVVSYREADTA